MTDKPTLSPAAREALMKCFATRGKNKGRLYSQAPGGMRSLTFAAWHGAQLACNPFKASIMGMMLMTPEQRAVREEVTAYFEARPALTRVADLDRDKLETLGVW